MKRQDQPDKKGDATFLASTLAASRFVAGWPFKLIGRAIAHTFQVVFALFALILHPQIKWLIRLITHSSLVKNYIRPSLQTFVVNYYEPYFAYLRELPPWWATFSIALPLAFLEPAKLYATVMIAERPKSGVLLWLFLQGLSLILIDRTWVAVRPQSRKIWFVSRLHAWVWLNVAYGKYWIRTSSFYRTLLLWKRQARREVRAYFVQIAPRRRRGKLR